MPDRLQRLGQPVRGHRPLESGAPDRGILGAALQTPLQPIIRLGESRRVRRQVGLAQPDAIVLGRITARLLQPRPQGGERVCPGLIDLPVFAQDVGLVLRGVRLRPLPTPQVGIATREQINLLQHDLVQLAGLAAAREGASRSLERLLGHRQPTPIDRQPRPAQRRVGKARRPGGIRPHADSADSTSPSASAQAPRQYSASTPPSPSFPSRSSRTRAAPDWPCLISRSTRPSSAWDQRSAPNQTPTNASPDQPNNHASRRGRKAAPAARPTPAAPARGPVPGRAAASPRHVSPLDPLPRPRGHYWCHPVFRARADEGGRTIASDGPAASLILGLA